jgi:hypothetical protein
MYNTINHLEDSTGSGVYPQIGDPIPSYGEVLVKVFSHCDFVASLEFRAAEAVFPGLQGEFAALHSFIA